MDNYIGDIILSERHDTRNGDTEAHSDDQFLRYNQYAQDRLYSLITLAYNWVFEYTTTVNITANQSEYTINDNVAFGTRITNVEYCPDNTNRFYPLSVTVDRYRTLAYTGRPRYWRRRHGTVVIEPTPDVTQGQLRITYERALDRLALRSVLVSGTPSGDEITIAFPTADEAAKYLAKTYICVSDYNGVPLLYNGVISAYNSGTPSLTLEQDVSTYLTAGTSLSDLANNCYITLGKYTTTHSKLPNEAEGFFVEWVNRTLHNIDSSDQFDTTDGILKEMKDAIVASFKLPDKARKRFPIDDFEMLIPEYD